ncbi:unnamed protein product [Bursaphelenchus okinawaensis]|uniref:CCHC-type domain-containing protein n=1 Tax=Bursaphelenchus okinawaensis TaxID=465554 RepID=A0A811L8G1_9BILA|nr:unnamed protein product [Bursaphelenchus okinawaensis]CAG9119133.1 unnamed protein product [Bursaphelenchus okinawaensis]
MANFEPLGAVRRIPGSAQDDDAAPSTLNPSTFVDAMGRPITQAAVSGACSKCGFAGHLPYQCRNLLPVEVDGVNKRAVDNASPSSSEKASSDESPDKKEDKKLKKLSVKKLKKQLKKLKKKNKKRKRKHSSSSDSESKEEKPRKSKKSKKRHLKKSKKESSSSSSDSD